MGWINLLLKGKKVAGKVIKRAKSDAQFAGAVVGVEVGKHAYNKLTGKKDIHEGTITGIVKLVKDKDKRKVGKVHKGEK